MLYELLKSLSIFFLRSFFKLEAKGREVLPRNKPFILASNHLSNLDPVILGSACPSKLCFLAKEELFENKLFALLLKNIGVLPLKRSGTDIRALRLAIKTLKDKPLVIFPQGQRGYDYDRFKMGVGFLYKKTYVPIIAAKIYGTDYILPRGSKSLRSGKIKVFFSRVEGLNGNSSYEEIASKVIKTIINL